MMTGELVQRPRATVVASGRVVLALSALLGCFVAATVVFLPLSRWLPRWTVLVGVVGVAYVCRGWLVRAWHHQVERDQREAYRRALVSHAWDCGLRVNDQALIAYRVKLVPGGFAAVVGVPRGLSIGQVRQADVHLAAAFQARQCWVKPDQERADLCEVRVLFTDPLAAGGEWRAEPGRVGATVDGSAVWDPERAAHLLAVGPTGSGKTTAMLGLCATLSKVAQAANSPGAMFALVDVKRTGWGQYRGGDRLMGVATTHDEAVDLLEQVHAEMLRRLEVMERARVEHRQELPTADAFGPLFLVVDEVTSLLAEDLPGEELRDGKNRARSSRAILANVARLGRQAGVHLMLGIQRPDASLLGGGEFRDNITARLLLGAMSEAGVTMVLGSEWKGLPLSGERGRGYWQDQNLTPVAVAVPYLDVARVRQAFGVEP